MDDEGIRSLEFFIQGHLRNEGLEELTNPDLYAETFTVDRPVRRFPVPPSRLRYIIGMIEAYDRHLSILDGSLFEKASDILAEHLESVPEKVLVEPSDELTEFSDIEGPLDLSSVPSLYDERIELLNLAKSIIESYDPESTPRGV